MKRRDVASLAVLVATIIVGSDTLKAEFLINYEVTPEEAIPKQDNILSVTNIGWFQADNATVLITANGTIDGFTDMCIEGEMRRLNSITLVVEFQRMSPQMYCHFKLAVSEPVHLSYMINSDGRLTPWFGWPSISMALLVLFGITAVSTIILIFSIKGFFGSATWYAYDFLRREKEFKETKGASKTREFVKKEYGQEIGRTDATILELIYHGKTTKSQLMEYSGLNLRQISYRIRKMRRYELVSENMELDKTLHGHFALLQWDL